MRFSATAHNMWRYETQGDEHEQFIINRYENAGGRQTYNLKKFKNTNKLYITAKRQVYFSGE